ncbi:SDR family NAD(P)-dependent oxidoreductase [Henriciella aquimarina]|uniref:SDR family NAD(P)-dependent oxidoreductase n=1 Tax=Henriciella aquimarina TaxID=545261 RepID=UPI000A05ABA9|nr:SDR family NAD(P)-dependent oxidoreductase [Henriciella aquimarina]
MSKLAGKVAVVTGGAGGMGRAHALRLASLGADIAIVDIDLDIASKYAEALAADTVQHEIESLGVRAISVEADLSVETEARDAVDKIASEFGRIDFLINNAGGAITSIDRSSAVTSSAEDRAVLFAANFETTVNMCQSCAPFLTRQGGAIVNISTIGAFADDLAGRLAMYGAAKAAVEKYSRSLAVELGPSRVRVNCIAPGLIETPRVKALAESRNLATAAQANSIPLRRLGQIEDVVGVMEFLVSDHSAYITGESIKVAGGHTLVAP